MERMARECDLALCHGGAGTTAALLLAGKPMLLVPSQMEQAMTAHRIAAMGAAQVVTPDTAIHFPKMLAAAIGSTAMRAAARAFADAHPSYDQKATIATAADRCESALRGLP
jgi:UDP:flavonoid glycosyltransferase YjiC (YdhE family)